MDRMIRLELAKAFDAVAKAKTRYGSDGDSLMAKGSTADASDEAAALVTEVGEQPQLTEEERAVSERTATLLQALIKKRWKGKDKGLARQADIDPSKLSVLKTKGTHKSIPSFIALCKELHVDPEALLRGDVVDVETPSRRSDLHAMLERIIGTPDEPAVEQVLRAFVKSREH